MTPVLQGAVEMLVILNVVASLIPALELLLATLRVSVMPYVCFLKTVASMQITHAMVK